MKKKYSLLFASAIVSLFVSCGPTEEIGLGYSVNVPTQPEVPTFTAPTAQQFSAVQATALENRTQHFTVGTNDPWTSFTSEKGVIVWLSGNCFTLNGVPVTGDVDIDYVELFDRGNMLVTNKTTMGVLPNGDKSLLLSGGEVYINVTQNGQQLENGCGVSISIPASLTGDEPDDDMSLWEGIIDDNGNIAWEEADNEQQEQFAGVEGGNYYAYFNHFGWTNVDRWFSDPRPKTTLLVDVPEGFDNTNSAVYISYNEVGNALANLDVYNEETGLFSEHYGQIPIGLECNVIFVSESEGNWIYAIKAVTIIENGIITFTDGQLQTATEAELIALIDALP